MTVRVTSGILLTSGPERNQIVRLNAFITPGIAKYLESQRVRRARRENVGVAFEVESREDWSAR
jgi:hypothetical protein